MELFFEFWRTAASFMRLPIQGPDSQEVMMNCAYELMDVGTHTHLKIKVHKFVCKAINSPVKGNQVAHRSSLLIPLTPLSLNSEPDGPYVHPCAVRRGFLH